jgi:hypothetical protein
VKLRVVGGLPSRLILMQAWRLRSDASIRRVPPSQ